MRILLASTLCLAVLTAGAICQANEKVAFVNPTQQPLYVQVNERVPFEVPPGDTVFTPLPALDRLAPITITARDERGTAVFHRAITMVRLKALGNRIELTPVGQATDPFEGSGAGIYP